jgi:hypothetical protein
VITATLPLRSKREPARLADEAVWLMDAFQGGAR